MIMKDAILFLVFKVINIFVQDWFKLLNIIKIDFKMDESMAESCITISQLQKELCILQSCSLDLKDLINDLLVGKKLIFFITLLWC